jgi:hypothetical protein
MKTLTKYYVTMERQSWDLTELDDEERQLVEDLQRRAESHPDWNDFDNYWLPRVASLYEGRGLSRQEVTKTPVWDIAQDLSGRIAISLGLMRLPDYRDDLRQIIREKFKTQRAFCEATGIGEDMLSHVLRGRKHLAIDTLAGALEKIGYLVRLVPKPDVTIKGG